MADAGEIWPEIVRRHGLRDLAVDSLASWWHTDADLGRTIETFTDMGHSRRLGFLGVRDTESSFTDLFRAACAAERIVRGALFGCKPSRCGVLGRAHRTRLWALPASLPRSVSRARASRDFRDGAQPMRRSISRGARPAHRGGRRAVRARPGRGRRAGRDVWHLRHGPARVRRRSDRDARRAAPADRRAEPADPRARVRGRRRRGRCGRDPRRRGRSRRDHAPGVLRSLRLLPARAAASVRDHGLRRALACAGAEWGSSPPWPSIRSSGSPRT